jgi:hypothetical protein
VTLAPVSATVVVYEVHHYHHSCPYEQQESVLPSRVILPDLVEIPIELPVESPHPDESHRSTLILDHSPPPAYTIVDPTLLIR